MKKLIVSCDGTWNTADQTEDGVEAQTNVKKLHDLIAAGDSRGMAQQTLYHDGVGADGLPLDRLAGGAIGAGLDGILCKCYSWLVTNYADGDDIYLFGFSRGAFTARSLAGLIHNS